MALSVPNSGPVDFLTLANVFGLTTPPYSLSSLKRDGTYVPSDIPVNSNIPNTLNNLNLRAFRGSGVQYTITLNNSTNVNLYTLFSASFNFTSTRKYVKFTIPAGVTIGSTSSGTPALDLGQFPSGTIIEIENNGNIYGAGGTAGSGGTVYGAAVGAAGGPTNGGNGGDAIKANYLNQTVTITNNSIVYGGGGGGGGGGKGANGANGSSGTLTTYSYQIVYRHQDGYAWFNYWTGSYWKTFAYYQGNLVFDVNGYYSSYGSYYRGGYVGSYSNPDDDLDDNTDMYQIGAYENVPTTVNTSGGTGGAGGNGGSGAIGRGNNNLVASLTGISGSTGSAGTAGGGGTATAGATGSTGGSGGNSGNWGLSGSSGTGINPGSGGTAGRYMFKGSATVTFTNNATIAGLLA